MRRAWFSSMTQTAIRDAFDAPARRRRDAAARGRRPRPLRGRLAGRHERHPRRHHQDRLARKLPLSLGRVQTPTLALIVRRDLEIAAFVPEDYWQVQAPVRDRRRAPATPGLWHAGSTNRLTAAEEAEAHRRGRERRRRASSSRSSASRMSESAPLLYDLTTLQREANSPLRLHRHPHARPRPRRCYEQHKVLTYPRTSSRYLSRRPRVVAAARSRGTSARADAGLRGARRATSPASTCCRSARVVNDAKVTDHHAIIPTDDAHDAVAACRRDERRIYDLVARRFLAVFHPAAALRADDGRDARRRGAVPLARQGADRRRLARRLRRGAPTPTRTGRTTRRREQALPLLHEGEAVHCAEAEVLAKQTKPPARYSRGARCCARWRPPASWSRTTRRPRR